MVAFDLTRQLGLPSPCCLAWVSRATPIKPFATPPGASKVAVGSGSFFRSPGSDSSASSSYFCSSASTSYIYTNSVCALRRQVVLVRALRWYHFFLGYGKSEGHLRMSYPQQLRAGAL